jgi:membrane protease YdiL (CAAX protease family)
VKNDLKKSNYELYTLPLPFVLWYFVFRDPILGFWPTLSVSALILLVVSAPRIRKMGFRASPSALALGVISAIALYLFFWSGYQVAKNIPGFVQTISSVYGLRGGASPQEIALLLLFPIGPTEELYWRGLIQRAVRQKVGSNPALLITTLLYTSIHIPTLNPSLLVVAFIGGLVWGTIYNRYGSILPVVISHVIFDEMIFVFFVIG